jgi:deazaflavin-dependent oxidoreductase (nitroreductase family)
MSFRTEHGTYGTRMPHGPVMRAVNALAGWWTRRSRGRAMGMDLLLLGTVGRRSGELRWVPVARFDEADGSWLVVASANGDARHPAWYLNLAANPRAVVRLGRRTVDVSATELDGAEREDAWRRIVAQVSQFARYAERTDRRIPVVRLVDVASATPDP